MPLWTVDRPVRLDVFLVECLEGASRSRAQQLIKEGQVSLNDDVVRKPSTALQEGDVVTLPESALTESVQTVSPIEPRLLPLPVLYEDNACMVLDKPAGYAVHPGSGMEPEETTILHGVAHLFADRGLPFSTEHVLVHRLDKQTTGCLLIAKAPQAHAQLQEQFSGRTVRKEYLAIVAGVPDPPMAVVDAPVGRNLTDRTKMSVLRTSVSREAKTSYDTLDTSDDCALVHCDLHTGRTHQVRVHMASVGNPLLGDETYETSKSRQVSQKYHAKRVCLHAWRLRFVSSDTDQEVEVRSEIPSDFREVLKTASLSLPKEQ